jgi:hypothetical protein
MSLHVSDDHPLLPELGKVREPRALSEFQAQDLVNSNTGVLVTEKRGISS